jgi:hypothetical protein
MIAIIQWLGILATAAAAILWLWASLVDVPDNIDTFVGQLQRASRLNAWAALAACVAASCAFVLWFVE